MCLFKYDAVPDWIIRHAETVGMRAQQPGNSLFELIVHTAMNIPRNPSTDKVLDISLLDIIIFV